MNPFIVESMVRRTLSETRRARARLLLHVAAGVASVTVGAVGVVALFRTGSTGATIWMLVGFGGATCFAVWGGWALRNLSRLERRIVEVVSAGADRAAGSTPGVTGSRSFPPSAAEGPVRDSISPTGSAVPLVVGRGLRLDVLAVRRARREAERLVTSPTAAS